MLPVWFGAQPRVHYVSQGRAERRHCPTCGTETLFRESVNSNECDVYSVLHHWQAKPVVLVCTSCEVSTHSDPPRPRAPSMSRCSRGESRPPELQAELDELRSRLGLVAGSVAE